MFDSRRQTAAGRERTIDEGVQTTPRSIARSQTYPREFCSGDHRQGCCYRTFEGNKSRPRSRIGTTDAREPKSSRTSRQAEPREHVVEERVKYSQESDLED